MKIVDSNVEISDSELDGLLPREREALQRKADQTNLTIAELFQGVLTDYISAAVAADEVIKLEASKDVSTAFVRADAATQDQIRVALGLTVVTPEEPAEAPSLLDRAMSFLFGS
jgi:hypothetical protein